MSARIAELGITFERQTNYDKSNEVPAVRELIKVLKIEEFMVVADALNCQKETTKAIIDGKADYLLNVKDNHHTLKENIADYVHDNGLRKTMDTTTTLEKIGVELTYVTSYIEWLYNKEYWVNLDIIGSIHTQFTTSKGTINEWYYYISSLSLTAEGLLKNARL